MLRVAANSVIRTLLVCVVIEASIAEIEALCLGCHSADPDTERNVVSFENFVFLH